MNNSNQSSHISSSSEAFTSKPSQVHFSRFPVFVKKRILAIFFIRCGFHFEPIQLLYPLKRIIKSPFIFKPSQVRSDFIFKTSQVHLICVARVLIRCTITVSYSIASASPGGAFILVFLKAQKKVRAGT